MQPQPIEYTQPVQYTQPGQSPSQYAQPATQYAQPQHTQQPVQFVQPAQPMMQAAPQQIVYVTQEKAPSKVLPWIGVVLILVSLLLPYISILGFTLSGFEMIGILSDMMGAGFGDLSSDGSGSGSGSGSGDSGDTIAAIGATMFMLSPIFFIFSAIVSALVLLVNKSPRVMGVIHLSYGAILIVLGLLMPTGLGFSVFDFIGFGFYMGAFSSGLLLAK
tara:strand:- start:41 stop:694 length:654 start_codon:yes stop_codon:yes gene_type:complete